MPRSISAAALTGPLARGDEKTMENIPNTIPVENFLKNPNRLILKFLSACDFYERYYKFTSFTYLNNFKKIRVFRGLFEPLITKFSYQ